MRKIEYKFPEITLKDKIVYKVKNTIKDIIGYFSLKKLFSMILKLEN